MANRTRNTRIRRRATPPPPIKDGRRRRRSRFEARQTPSPPSVFGVESARRVEYYRYEYIIFSALFIKTVEVCENWHIYGWYATHMSFQLTDPPAPQQIIYVKLPCTWLTHGPLHCCCCCIHETKLEPDCLFHVGLFAGLLKAVTAAPSHTMTRFMDFNRPVIHSDSITSRTGNVYRTSFDLSHMLWLLLPPWPPLLPSGVAIKSQN